MSRDGVDCGKHGYGEATYVCPHLPRGKGRGWFTQPSDEDAAGPWPDAWCADCDRRLQSDDEAAEVELDFVVVCDGCYEAHREANWPKDVTGHLASLIARARERHTERQQQLADKYQIESYHEYSWQQDPRRLVLSAPRKPRLVAAFQMVGSYSQKTNTWLWPWAQTHYTESELEAARCVRAYGDEHKLLRLASAHWPATEQDAWDMVAVAASLYPSEGGFRVPHATGFSYLLITSVQRRKA
ncbi:MAG: hypothetical protein HOW73_05000 [Polyangiaceae bacterium]|nr:hypothetical protein [Polyangiaceae bacterium]